MGKIDELAQLLERLNAGEHPSSVKVEAQEFLASIDPQELSLAEQKLIEAGLEPADLRCLCSAHMEMLGGELEEMKADLQPGHVIHTLTSEHDLILGFLNQLEEVNRAIQGMGNRPGETEEFGRLEHIAQHLIGAEPHHQREEEVLFPELERRGIWGPPQVMRMEHEDLRNHKKELLELAEKVDKLDFDTFKQGLDKVAKSIIRILRDHIFKENNILYPTALETIGEEEVWGRMKAEGDEIGYCCFTPQG